MKIKIISINIMHHFYHQTTVRMYLQANNMTMLNKDFVVITMLFWIYYEKNQRVCHGMHDFFPPTKINDYHIWPRLVNTLIAQSLNSFL